MHLENWLSKRLKYCYLFTSALLCFFLKCYSECEEDTEKQWKLYKNGDCNLHLLKGMSMHDIPDLLHCVICLFILGHFNSQLNLRPTSLDLISFKFRS